MRLPISASAAEMLAVSDEPEETLQSLGFYEENGVYRYTVDDHYRLTADIARFTQPSGVLATVTLGYLAPYRLVLNSTPDGAKAVLNFCQYYTLFFRSQYTKGLSFIDNLGAHIAEAQT